MRAPTRIILASTSPRRKMLLEQIGLEFEIIPGDYEEDMTLPLPPHKLVMTLAKGKAMSVARKQKSGIIVAVREERFQARNKEIALEILRAKLWEKAEQERLSKIESGRAAAVGRGMRSEKIKTYNFPQNRLTDHRLAKSWYSLKEIIEGDLSAVLLYTLDHLGKNEG